MIVQLPFPLQASTRTVKTPDVLDKCLNMAFSLPSTTTSSSKSAAKKPATPNKPLMKAKSTLSVCPTPPTRLMQKSSSLRSLTTATTSSTAPSTPITRRLLKPVTAAPSTPECFTKVSLETPVRRLDRHNQSTMTANASMLMTGSRGEADQSRDGEISNLKVAIRVRPLTTKELISPTVSNVVQMDGNEVVVFAGNSADNSAGLHHRYQYDHVFWSCNSEHRDYCGQEEVFRELARPLLDRAFEGYNTCLFAYGQTSSGKSYSMMGIDGGAGEENNFLFNG